MTSPGSVASPRPPPLPAWCRALGLSCALAGAALAVARFRYGFRPAVLDAKLFAVYSAYFEVKTLGVIEKNATDELALLLVLGGLVTAAMSKERTEDGRVAALRLKAALFALSAGSAAVVAAAFFFFGLGFVYVLVANLVVPLVLYLATFRWLAWRHRGEPRGESR